MTADRPESSGLSPCCWSNQSLAGAARAYLKAGARRISAVATHGVLPGDALEKLRATGLFAAVAVTDSHPRALQLQDGFLRVETIAQLLAEELFRGTP